MPTPFMHLQIAERILRGNRLNTPTQDVIARDLPAFYLGNVAPDYQTICDIPREETHFYYLPPGSKDNACRTMLKRYPELSEAALLSASQATFVAGYCAHLMLDLRWYFEILVPFFLGQGEWTDHRHRFIVHNTLLTYLDKRAFDSLPETAADTMEMAKPNGWLPFASDAELRSWREYLAGQLVPGANLQTIEIYAGRLSMSTEEFAANLDRPVWMEEQVFSKVPLQTILLFLDSAVRDSVDLITNYLAVT